jgi:hypothetical protein
MSNDDKNNNDENTIKGYCPKCGLPKYGKDVLFLPEGGMIIRCCNDFQVLMLPSEWVNEYVDWSHLPVLGTIPKGFWDELFKDEPESESENE